MKKKTGEIVEELKSLDETAKESDHFFDCVDKLHYKLHKTSLNKDGASIDSPEWLNTSKQQSFQPIKKMLNAFNMK